MKKHRYTVEFEKAVLRRLLSTNDAWAKRALVRIYNAQTCDEKQCGETMHENGVGFTGTDARLLTQIAKWYVEKNFIGAGYMQIVHQKMPKYAGQIFDLSDFDHDKFDSQIEAMIASGAISSEGGK